MQDEVHMLHEGTVLAAREENRGTDSWMMEVSVGPKHCLLADACSTLSVVRD